MGKVKIMKKKLAQITLVIIAILSLLGCANTNLVEENRHIDSGGLTETTDIGEDMNINIVEANPPLEDKQQLREKLLEAVSIELKDTENSTVGMLQESEKIVKLVDNLFKYRIEEEYTNSQQVQVVGPINFYFSNGEDIYGLMYNQYIYIEGYYFLINRRISQELQNLFKSNIASAPITSE